MTIVTEFLYALGLGGVTDEARNVLLWPVPPPPPAIDAPVVVEGDLVQPDGDIASDASGPRVSAILGPGATVAGVAAVLQDILGNLTTRTTAVPMPDGLDILRALLGYSAVHLTSTPEDRLKVGFRIPLPIEIDEATSTWTTNLESLQTWRDAVPGDALQTAALTVTGLDIPDPDALRDQVRTQLEQTPDLTILAGPLVERLMINPYEPVFEIYELFHQVQPQHGLVPDRSAEEPGFAMAIIGQLVQHQADLLGTTTGGNAVLRRLWTALNTTAAAALPAGQQADLTSSRRLVATALGLVQLTAPDTWEGPLDVGPVIEAREPVLPASASPNPTKGNFGPHTTATESPDGQQVLVLGRQLSAGKIVTYGNYNGPSHGGRIDPAAFAAQHGPDIGADASNLSLLARVGVVAAIANNEGWLDAARLADAGIVSTGLQQWTEHHNDEAAVLWEHYRGLSPDHFDLYFGLYGLLTRIWGATDKTTTAIPSAADLTAANPWADPNVINFPAQLPADPDEHFPRFVTLYRIDPGSPGVRMPEGSAGPRFGFFGGTITTAGQRRFGSAWAGRVRIAALCSIEYRVAEMQTAAKRFDRITFDTNRHASPPDPNEPAIGTPDFTIPGAPTGAGGQVPKYSVGDLFTTQYGAALVLDHHINAPANVKADIRTAITQTAGPAFVGGDIDGGWRERLAVKYQQVRRFPDPAAKTARDNFLVGRLNAGALSNSAGSFEGW
jgi:hypothetical protein